MHDAVAVAVGYDGFGGRVQGSSGVDSAAVDGGDGGGGGAGGWLIGRGSQVEGRYAQ